ncbi:MAG: transglutaminase-like cysteine peptidase [Pseudomonadota bacterium]
MLSSSVPRLAALVVVGLVATTGSAVTAVPFDPTVQPLSDKVRLPRWEAALQEIADDRGVLQRCLAKAADCPLDATRAWRSMMLDAGGTSAEAKLESVNRFVNGLPYARDEDRKGVLDHWSGPLEFLAEGGDCEDYAIAKYVSLRELGMAPRDLRIVVLEDRARGLAHAILAVRLGREVWVLDNHSDAIEPFTRLPHYDPYYAVNEDGRWLHRIPGQPTPAAPTH